MILFVEHQKCMNEIKFLHPFPPLHSVRTRNVQIQEAEKLVSNCVFK